MSEHTWPKSPRFLSFLKFPIERFWCNWYCICLKANQRPGKTYIIIIGICLLDMIRWLSSVYKYYLCNIKCLNDPWMCNRITNIVKANKLKMKIYLRALDRIASTQLRRWNNFSLSYIYNIHTYNMCVLSNYLYTYSYFFFIRYLSTTHNIKYKYRSVCLVFIAFL